MVPAAGLTQVNAGHHKMRHDINPIDSEEGGKLQFFHLILGVLESRYLLPVQPHDPKISGASGGLGGRSCWRLCDLRSRGAEAGSRANITQPQAGITPLAPQVLGGRVFAP